LAKIKLVIDSKQDLQSLKTRIRASRVQLLQWQATNVRKLANIIILEAIQKRMNERGFSPKIIDNTHLTNIEIRNKKVRIFIESEYFSETGFDVALAREKGTKRHFIGPVEKQALMFIQLGKVRFSKGHYVDGMQAFLTIARTIDQFKGNLQDEYNRQLFAWLKTNLGNVVA